MSPRGIAEMATKAGIPLASYDDLILGAEQAGYHRPRSEGRRRGGRASAVVAKVPKGNYVLIGGDAGQTGSTLMQEGYHVVLDPLVAKGDIKIVMDQFTPAWKTEPAQANAENALTANNNNVQAFLVSYDGMSLGVLQAIEAAGIEPGKILVTGQDMELSAAQAIVEGRQFGSLWPAPDEMAIAGAKAAVAMAQCKDIGATTTADNGAGQIPWVKTPIYLVSQERDGRLRLQASVLAEDRRGLQERSGQEAGLPVEPPCRTATCRMRRAASGRRPAAPAGRLSAPLLVGARPDQGFSRRACARRRRLLASRRARSSRCSARTVPASRR